MSIRRLSPEDYFAIDAVNWSTLRHMRQSPAHYRHASTFGREDNDTLRLGRATHTAILEPDRFALDYAVYKGKRRAGKAWDAFKEANADRTILTVDQYDLCCTMRDAVRAHPLAAPYLADGDAEVAMQWTDPDTRIPCKARLDWRSRSKPAIVDLKTARSTDARRFASAAATLGYHGQAAFYSDGHLAVTGARLQFVIIAVEKDPPWDVAVFLVDEDALYAGQEEKRELMARVAECRASGQWPGRYEDERVLELPRWVFGDDEEIADGIDFGDGKESAA